MIEYGARTRYLPALPHIVWEDLVSPKASGTRAWLALLDDEVAPVVLEQERPARVVWSSLWPSRPDDRLVMELSARGAETALRFTLLAEGDPPDEGKAGHIRKRINELLFAELRHSYGQ